MLFKLTVRWERAEALFWGGVLFPDLPDFVLRTSACASTYALRASVDKPLRRINLRVKGRSYGNVLEVIINLNQVEMAFSLDGRQDHKFSLLRRSVKSSRYFVFIGLDKKLISIRFSH